MSYYCSISNWGLRLAQFGVLLLYQELSAESRLMPSPHLQARTAALEMQAIQGSGLTNGHMTSPQSGTHNTNGNLDEQVT